MRTIKIDFIDFWSTWNKEDNYFINLLRTCYQVEISPDPDFIIYSVFGKKHREYRCTRIFYTGENVRPNFKECDYAFSFDFLEHPRHFRLPLYVLYLRDNPAQLIKGESFDPELVLSQKSKFCNFVYSNKKAQKRIKFFEKLSRYKRVDSGGRVLNNIGTPIQDKLKFIQEYKFTIAFENGSYPGYTTEKLIEPMQMNSLPIYWGNPLVEKDFNTKSFLSYFDYDNDEALIERIMELDKDNSLYCKYLAEPYYHNNQLNDFVKLEIILQRFNEIFDTEHTPVAQKKKRFLVFG